MEEAIHENPLEIRSYGPQQKKIMPRNYYMPAEWYRHSKCWMLWPYRGDNWRNNAARAREAFLQVATAIAKFEPVTFGVRKDCWTDASNMLNAHKSSHPTKHDINMIEIESDDCWMRDCGPTFVIPKDHNLENPLAGIDWDFNAWGGKLPSWSLDEKVAAESLKHSQATRFKPQQFVLEGGSIHVDGEGTVITTEQCLLHPNRNPHLTKSQIESYLLEYLGATKVIWLPRGLTADDDTDGHIDNFCCFVAPGKVLLAWSDDEDDEQYAISREAYAILQQSTDAHQRPLEIIKMPIPSPKLTYSAEEIGGLIGPEGMEFGRHVGVRLAGSYVNFYLANGGVVMPCFQVPTDAQAKEILQSVFPEYEIVQVSGREILLGGGNIHCITQQEPQWPPSSS